ncbi:MAG TPA: hypothetical protein VGG30_01640, partial [Pirellulales bacterium]
MTGSDEYESVLGLPPGPRPPNHYELLGLELFAASAEVIAAAADGRIVDAEESVLGSAEQIRQVIEKIRLAKACLLDPPAKADYDRQLNHGILGVPDDPGDRSDLDAGQSLLAEPGLLAGPNSNDDSPPDTVQFEPLPADLITAARPKPKRRSRKWFWAFTFVEGLCVVALYFYFHPREPVTMPSLPVRSRSTIGQWKATSPLGDPQVERPPQRETVSGQTAPPPGPVELGGPDAPREPVATHDRDAPGTPVAPSDLNAADGDKR